MTIRILALSALLLALAACGEKAAEATRDAAAAATTDPVQSSPLPRTASGEGAGVFFITPHDGSTVSNPVSIEFGISGMEVVKAGDNQPNSGHHHLLIDTDVPDLGLPIPSDAHHMHFGDGSTATEITLAPGEHTLQMLLGDHLHIPHGPALVSDAITITVE